MEKDKKNIVTHASKKPFLTEEEYNEIIAFYPSDPDKSLEINFMQNNGLMPSKLQGNSRTYDLGTKILTEKKSYKDNCLHGLFETFDPQTGNLTFRTNLKHGLVQGPAEMFDPNTKHCISRFNYVDDTPEGPYEEFDPKTGNCINRYNYARGQLDGPSEKLDPKTGKLTSIGIFKNYELRDLTLNLFWTNLGDTLKAFAGVKADRTIEKLNQDQRDVVLKNTGINPK